MANEQVSNLAQSTVSSGLSNVTDPVTFVITSATNFPTTGNFRILVESEILKVTAVAGTSLTCGRAQEGTAAASHANGTTVTHILTALGTEQMMIDRLPLELSEGRLTLSSGNAVTTSDQTAKTTVYFTPYKGNRVALYTGSKWIVDVLSEQSVAVPSNTSTPFDVFAFDNAGAVNIETLAWTNGSTRATALTTQDGIYVKSGVTTRRYLGTCQTTGVSGQCEDSALNRFVWNYYHRVRQPVRATEQSGVSSWTYTSTAWRSANGSTLNRVSIVHGVAESMIDLALAGLATSSSASFVAVDISIGEDSTTTPSANSYGSRALTYINDYSTPTANLRTIPAIGSHYYQWLERGSTGVTFYGDNFSGSQWREGLSGWWEC